MREKFLLNADHQHAARERFCTINAGEHARHEVILQVVCKDFEAMRDLKFSVPGTQSPFVSSVLAGELGSLYSCFQEEGFNFKFKACESYERILHMTN